MKKEIVAQRTVTIGMHKGQRVEIDYKLTKCGCFTASGGYWNRLGTDYNQCGQCLDQIIKDFPHSDRARRIHHVWVNWHLNDLTAGSPLQEAEVAKFLARGNIYNYGEVCKHLVAKGLNPDESYMHRGEPYKYGHAWLKTELPAEVIEEIKSW